MTTEQRNIQLGATVDTTGVAEGLGKIKEAGRDVARAVSDAGQQASNSLDAIGTAGEASALKMDKATKSLATSIARATAENQRALSSMETGSKAGSADMIENYARRRGAAIDQLRPQIDILKSLESQLSVVAARERELASVSAFEKQTADAAKLAKASDYVRMWEEELQKAEQAERRLASQTGFVDSLKKQADAIGKTRADLLEMQAAQMGVSTQAAPFIARMREQEQAFRGMGMSAGQLNNALRGVPAQFTDIFVSLSSGQNPMTVLMQQGGQLKDMFGGAGEAAKALGGYVLSIIGPFTILATTAAVVGAAYYQGSKEADEYRKSLILTGNAAGTTVGQMSDLARAIADSTGATQGAAAEAVAQAAGTGKIASANLGMVSEAAIRMQRATGTAVDETIKQFVELGKEPVKASEKLNEAANYLTADIYKQIKALDDQGKSTEAAALAQKAWADALTSRTTEIESNLGDIERAWRGVRDGAKSAWDSMLGIGRKGSISDQIAAQQKTISNIRDGSENGNIEVAQNYLKVLQEQAGAEQKKAAATGDGVKAEAAKIAWLKEGEKYLSKSEERERAIAKAKSEGLAAGASELEINKRIAAIREKMADPKERKAGKSQKTKDAEEFARVMDRLAEKSADLNAAYFKDLGVLSKAKDAGRFGAGAEGAEKYQMAVERLIKTQKIYTDQEAAYIKQQESGAKALASAADDTSKLQDKLDAMSVEADAYGKTESAVYRLLAAKAADRAEMNSFGDANDAMIAQLTQQRDIYLGLADAKQRAENINNAQRALDQLPGMEGKFDLKIDTSSLKSAFAGLGGDLSIVIDKLQMMTDVQANFGKQSELIAKAKLGNAAQYAEAVQAEIALNQRMLQASIGGYADIISAAKGFVGERTKGYKAMEGAEKAFRLVQLGMAVSNAAKEVALVAGITTAKVEGDQAATDSSVAATEAELYQAWLRGQANATTAITVQASGGDPYSAFVRMAAMAAAMAALGFSVGGGGGGTNSQSAAAMQANTGTGTVLGDAAAKSESITKALEALADVDTLTMQYSAQMASSLRNIETSMGGLASLVVRTYGLTTGNASGLAPGAFDVQPEVWSQAIGAVINVFTLGLMPGISSAIGNLFGSSKTTLIDSGVQFDSGTVGSMAGGVGFSQYATLETKKKAFGMTYDSDNRVVNTDLPDEIARQFGLVFTSLGDSLSAAAGALGLSADDIGDKVNAFTVDMSRISLKGLSGDKVQEALTNYFSGQFDRITAVILPGFEDFQKVGEGYYETIIRVASGVEQASYYTDRLGISLADLSDITGKQGDVTAELVRTSILAAEGVSSIGLLVSTLSGSAEEISSAYADLIDVQRSLRAVNSSSAEVTTGLIRAAGGLDALKSSLENYYETFYSEAEQQARKAADVARVLATVGISTPATKEAFRAIVEGLDLTTAAGQRQFAVLMQVAGDFATATDAAAESMAKASAAIDQERKALEDKYRELTSSSAARRAYELAALDPSNRALQLRIWSLQDEKKATEQAIAAGEKRMSTLNALSSALHAAVSGAVGDAAGSALDARRRAQAQIDTALVIARASGGSALPDLANLQGALSEVGKPSAALFGTFEEYARDVGRTAGSLSQLADITDSQKTIEQKSLDALKSQIDADGIYHESSLAAMAGIQETATALLVAVEGMKTITPATKNVASSAGGNIVIGPFPAFAAGGLHAGGFRVVGEDGPEIEFTPPSRIFSNSQSMNLLSGDSSLQELRSLRNDIRDGLTAIAIHTSKTARLHDRWEVDGMPEVRV